MSREKPDGLERAEAVAEAQEHNVLKFRNYAWLAGLDPAEDFRFRDWSDVEFSGLELTDFDFTGARLHGCDFRGSRIFGARFDQAELGIVEHMTGPWREANRNAPGRVSPVANLHEAADWEEYRRSWQRNPDAPTSDAHLPVGAIFQDAPFALQMIVVPAGEFWMGSPDGEEGHYGDGGPRHRVTIPASFAIGQFAVTFEEWDIAQAHPDWKQLTGIAPRAPSDNRWGRKDRPVIDVSWEDARAYCAWLAGVTGQTYRLPSEAEWEYVCRAGTETPFWWGDEITTGEANFEGDSIYGRGSKGEYRGRTVPVGSFQPNPWGLHQVHGNVWEWVEDNWHDYDDDTPTDGSARTWGGKKIRVVRGGSWNHDPRYLRSASRNRGRPDNRYSGIGFRVARSLSR